VFNRIRVVNFKCYRDSGEVLLRPLTIIVGPNNVGKSTLLHAILMLKQTLLDQNAGEALVTAGRDIDLGSYRDIINVNSTVQRDL